MFNFLNNNKNVISELPDGVELIQDDYEHPHTYSDTNTYYAKNKITGKIEKLEYDGKTLKPLYKKNLEDDVCIDYEATNMLPFKKLLINSEYNESTSFYFNDKKCEKKLSEEYFVSNYNIYYKKNPTPTEQPVTKETGGKRAKSRRQKRRTRKTRKHRKPSKK